MISTILATIAFLIIAEGLLVMFISKDLKKAISDLVKKRNAVKIIRKIGTWEALIGLVVLIIAVFLRNI